MNQDPRRGPLLFILAVVVVAVALVVWMLMSATTQGQIRRTIAPKPPLIRVSQVGDFLLINQMPRRVSAIRKGSIVAMAVYDIGGNVTRDAGWPNISVTIGGTNVRVDVQTYLQAREFVRDVIAIEGGFTPEQIAIDRHLPQMAEQ